jgi:hypothetical protein
MARKILSSAPRLKRQAAGQGKVSMHLPAELAWRLRVKSIMEGVGLGELCEAALWPVVGEDNLPWERYKRKMLGTPSDGRQAGTEGSEGKDPVESAPIAETLPAATAAPGSGGGEKGRKDPAKTRASIASRRAG